MNNQNYDFAQIHRANLLQILERRLVIAKRNGESQLIQQLEAEKTYLNA
ncbi:MAG: hypothetical protein HC890_03735 [Chloroflexaceae bacterium]|nr:hypothetical protein [Chloroflexaceae bacterium]